MGAAAPPRTPPRRALALAALGVGGGLVIGEGLAAWRDRGAFPHLNLYVPDAALGVRLRPHAAQRLAVAGNRPTTVTTEAHGLRGPPWPPPEDDEVLVVGDSQVFGLGVEDHETTPAWLAEGTGRVVRNGGVPTYGPREYLALADALLEERPARDLVVVFNLANDLFELDRPNTARHAVWDGWAVRAETAPPRVVAFPGRDALYRRSHLFFALRRAWHAAVGPGEGVPSEGGWADVLLAFDQTAEALAARAEAEEDARAAHARAYRVAAAELPAPDDGALAALYGALPDVRGGEDALALQAVLRGAHPGDIVHDQLAEASRGIEVTAEHLRRGAALRLGLAHRLRRWAAEHPDTWQAGEIRARLAVDSPTRARLDALAALSLPDLPPSPLEGWVDDARELAARHGASLTVAVLPLDVQVSEAEWAKYGQAPVDMSGTLTLVDDLVATVRRRGVRAVSLRPTLAHAQPGAFLDGDLHLTPRGHRAVAEALARALDEPPPGPGGLPRGRTRTPWPRELDGLPEVVVRGSTANHCETVRLREWLRVRCLPTRPGGAPAGLSLVAGPTETWASWGPGAPFDLVTPLLVGREADVVLAFPDGPQALTVRWDGAAPTLAFAPWGEVSLLPAVEVAGRIVAGPAASCAGAADPAQCLQGLGDVVPTCGEGTASAGAAGWCLPRCEHAPCAVGRCEPWGGDRVCL